MMSNDHQPQDTVVVKVEYQAPRVTVAGAATKLINGAWSSGYTDSKRDFYHYGE